MNDGVDETAPVADGSDGSNDEFTAAGGADAPRPADVARRALRAAREREVRDADSVDDESAQPTDRGVAGSRKQRAPSPGARPGDAAREALRRATPVGRGAGIDAAQASDADGEPDQAPSRAVAGAGPTATRPAEGTPPGARPGDIAREALRAARIAARQTRTDTDPKGATGLGSKGVEEGHRSTDLAPPGSGARQNTRSRNRRTQAQDVRDLLAGAFQLPADTAPKDAAATDHSAHADADAETGGHWARLENEQPGTTPDPARSEGDGAADLDVVRFGGDGAADLDEVRSGGDVGAAQSYPGPPGGTGESTDSHPAQLRKATLPSSGASPLDVPPPPSGGETSGPRPAYPKSAEHPPPTAATRPRSMGSPGRDGELRRTFEAFPARAAGEDGFAETWWGNAWVDALEEGALDAARLARGRAYAGRGHVDAITVTPGLVLAYVHGSRPRPYRVQVGVETLSDGDWDRFLDAVAARPGDIAALLDKEVPRSLAECGVALLPGPGELEPRCSCPDSGHPCKHAAALCYQTARLLDEDPFVLLLLRGRGERELLDALSRRNATRIARAAQDQGPAPLPGIRAGEALARRVLPPLPAPLPAPAHPEQPPTYPGAPGGPDPFALDQLATDAAARAHALLTVGRDPVAGLTLWQDAVRLAAARPGSGLTAGTRTLYASLASATGRTRADLARAVAAWRQGGFAGLTVLEEPWDPPAGRFDRARPLLLAADLPAFRPWRNHLTHPRGHAQLRLGRSGLWYAYESEPGQDDWWPRGTPDLDPVGALTGLGAPGDL